MKNSTLKAVSVCIKHKLLGVTVFFFFFFWPWRCWSIYLCYIPAWYVPSIFYSLIISVCEYLFSDTHGACSLVAGVLFSSPRLHITLCSVIIPFQYTPQHLILPKNLKTFCSTTSPSVSISTYLDPGVVSLIEVMYCLFYWSCVLSEHQCRVHSLACSFPLSKQTLDLCFEAFIKQKHPLWSLTGLAYSEKKKKKNLLVFPWHASSQLCPHRWGYTLTQVTEHKYTPTAT